ncbi:MAG: membrane protein insertase YidC [Chloroflexi bacterium]|nr:membrane protein insertase YidC [Chloroflexota bacterium]
MDFLALLWNEVITKPMTNGLLLLYVVLAGNLGLAIIAFTIVMRVLTYPLVVRQLRQTRRMQQLQPRIKDLNEKYKDNPQVRGQEVMKLYKEMGVNPIGCLGPMVVQMPIFIGLFWTINNVLPFTPEILAGLSGKLYSWLPFLNTVLPVDRLFLGMDLALAPTRAGSLLGYVLVAASGASMFVQQKMTQMPSSDARQESTQRMMLFMFPVMFGMFSLFFPLGLVVYWVASTLIGIAMQYFITGWGGLRKQPVAVASGASRLGPTLTAAPPEKEQADDREPEHRPDSQDGGSSDRASAPRARRRPRRSRGRRR